MKNKIIILLINCSLLITWQILATVINAPYILPTPIQILYKIWELRVPLFTVHLPYTMLITSLGLGISVILGIFLSVIMDLFPSCKKILYPIIVSSQTIPTIAIAPLFILWFGYGIWSKVVVTVLITFFAIVINVYDGLQSAKEEMKELLITFGATKMQIFFILKVKTALPYFISSIKMAIPISIIGAAIGEWLGSQMGLGYFSKRMMTQLDGAGVFAPIVILSVLAMFLVFLVDRFEQKFINWRDKI